MAEHLSEFTLGAAPGAQLLTGTNTDILRQASRRFALMLPPYLAAVTTLALAAYFGVTTWPAVVAVSLYIALGLAVLGGLLRSGITLRMRDPMLVFPQVLFNVTVVWLGFWIVDVNRSVVLLWLALIVVYDMRRLPLRQVIQATGLALALIIVTVLKLWYFNSAEVNLAILFMDVGFAVISLPALIAVSAQARVLRKRQVANKEDLTRNVALLQKLAISDPLTGLYNRRYMLKLLAREVKHAQRCERPFCVAMLDIDFFKKVNDRFGHNMGDTVLKVFGRLATEVFPGPIDAVARWGGEEFVVLLPETSATLAYARLQRLRARVRAYDWHRHHPQLSLTFSAGLAQYVSGQRTEDLIDQADKAMYEAKAHGRDHILPGFDVVPEADLPADAGVAIRGVPDSSGIYATVVQRMSGSSSARDAGQPRPRKRRQSYLSALVFTDDVTTLTRLRLVLIAAAIYLCWMFVLVFYLVPGGILTQTEGVLFFAQELFAIIVPYMAIRSGFTKRFKDPGIVLFQYFWACIALIVSYAVAPICRIALLQVLCLIQVFGFMNLTPRQARDAGATVIFLLVGMWAVKTLISDPLFNPVRESLCIGTACIVIGFLAAQSVNYNRTREKVREDKRQLVVIMDEVQRLTNRDPLTDLWNRQYLQENLNREVERHQRSGHGFCVALIDLDHFKQINDRHGHPVGDEVLAGFGRTAEKMLRETDVIGRWGGEEFLVLMTGTETEKSGLAGMERLRMSVMHTSYSATVPKLRTTFSAGIADHIADESWAQTLERADGALYKAKRLGRNQCLSARAT